MLSGTFRETTRFAEKPPPLVSSEKVTISLTFWGGWFIITGMKSQPKEMPMTTAIRALKAAGVAFEPRAYEYVEHGGTSVAAEQLQLDEHAVIKTIVLETDEKKPLIVLMHGDRDISTKQMARILGVKSVSPCEPETASRHTGYFCGGTSPFGTRKRLPVYAEETIFELPEISINGGRRGLMVTIRPEILEQMLPVTRVQVAIERKRGG